MIPEEYYLNSKLMIRPEFGHPYRDVEIRTTVCEEHPIHIHDCMEIVYVHRGRFEYRISCDSFALKQGEFIVVNPVDLHGLRAVEPGSVLSCIHLSPRLLPYDEGFVLWYAELLKRDEKAFYRQAENLRLLIAQYEERADERLIQETLARIVGLFRTEFRLESVLMTDAHEDVDLSEEDLNRAGEIYWYIYRCCDEKLSLESLAERFAFSKHYFSHYIKKITGYSVQQLLAAARCDRAEIALLDSSRTIEDIRMDFGFSSAQYFNESFKKMTGTTPGAYRRTWQKYTVMQRSFAEHPAENVAAILSGEEKPAPEETVVELHIPAGEGILSFIEYRDGIPCMTGYEINGEERIRIDCAESDFTLLMKRQEDKNR